MDDEELRVANLVRSAFHGITLGNGVGLRQGCGLDDYASPKALARLREQDEQRDWTAISHDDLNEYSVSLSFFDGEGMRFHLPAYLIANLEGAEGPDLIFHLTYPAQAYDPRFELLNDNQRSAVREFLLLHLRTLVDPIRGIEAPSIEKALEVYWN